MANLIEIQGFAELQNQIMQLADDKDKKREILLILRQVAKDTVRVAKQNAPVSNRLAYTNIKSRKTYKPGTLRDSIGIITTRKSVNPVIYVGPKVKGKNDGWYGHIVEYGHAIYKNDSLKGKVSKNGRKRRVNERITRKRKGVARSFVDANPFMARTYQQTQGQALQESQQRITAFIQRRINKLSNQ